MPLTITPGGASDDALVSLVDFKAYADARGWDYSAMDDAAEIEPAIRRGTVWVEGVGGPTERLPKRWPGVRASASQRREWPRSGAVFTDGTAISASTIPTQVADAVSEAAWFDLNNAGILFATVTPTDVVKSESVGGAGVKVEYRDGGDVQAARVMLTSVRDLLASILVPDLKGPSLWMGSVGKVI